MTVPYHSSDVNKKVQMAEMFDNISSHYDFLNHFLSLGLDKCWRKQIAKHLKMKYPKVVLDVATGTGDLTIYLSQLNVRKIVGIDISEKMLAIGNKKIERRKLNNIVELQIADAENLPFKNNEFDAVTCAFGVRNFENLQKGLSEMQRVLKKRGTLIILEFSKTRNLLFNFYFKHILPSFGKWISKDTFAYSYLPASVNLFPEKDIFLKMLKNCGFDNEQQKTFTFGSVTLYLATKL